MADQELSPPLDAQSSGVSNANLAITTDFIRSLPKTDLHVHLDGSLRIKTLIDLAQDYSVDLPSYTEEGLRELVFKDRYNSLGDYLKGFAYSVAVMQSEVANATYTIRGSECSYERLCRTPGLEVSEFSQCSQIRSAR